MATRLIALLGDPVEHSLSPLMQNAAIDHLGLDARYLALRCDAEDVPGLVRGIARAGGAGNVTVPHKELVAGIVERPSRRVRTTGACNSFWHEDGRIHGDNTDVGGLVRALRATGGVELGAVALVIGAGGAARSAVAALSEEGVAEIRVRNRTRGRAESLIGRPAFERLPARLSVDEAQLGDPIDPAVSLVVNATTLGLHDDDPFPADPRSLPDGCRIVDLVYRPEETAFVRAARAAGHFATDGLEMLLQQGALAFELWWERDAPIEAMRATLPERSG